MKNLTHTISFKETGLNLEPFSTIHFPSQEECIPELQTLISKYGHPAMSISEDSQIELEWLILNENTAEFAGIILHVLAVPTQLLGGYYSTYSFEQSS